MTDDNNLPEDTGPDVTTPQTYEKQVEELSNLLEDPETDHPEEPEDSEAAEPEEEEDDDPLGLNDDAEDVEQDDDEEPDGSEEAEIKGGRFAPDSAKVTLDDGTVITVSELKRNNLFQRDYTRKTTELAEKTKEVEAKVSEVSQQAQSLDEFRDYAAWYAETYLPKQPEPFNGNPDQDPIGYLQWTKKRDDWVAHAQAWQAFQQQKTVEEQRKSGETQKQAQARMSKELDALYQAVPVLKDPVKGKAVWSAIVSGAQEHYQISEDEVKSIGDHRMLVALRDALAYRRIKAKAPQVQAQVSAKPAMKPGKRTPPQAAKSKERQARSERLRKSGRFEDGVAALQDFDL